MRNDLFSGFHLHQNLTHKLGDFWFFEDFIWAEMKEGIHLKIEDAQDIVKLGYHYYKTSGCYYVSNRINSYSTQVSDFIPLEKLPFLKGFVMINYSRSNEIVSNVEQLFFKKPFKIFHEEEEAVRWLRANSHQSLKKDSLQ